MLVHHYTNEASLKDIEESGAIKPLSSRSAIGYGWMQYLLWLPKTHSDKGLYGILDKDLTKWNSDAFACKHFAKLKSKKGSLVKLSFELIDTDMVEVLDEKVLYYDLLQELVIKRNIKSLIDCIPIALPARSLYCHYIDSRIPLQDYRGEFTLPVVFIGNSISLERIVKKEIIPSKDKCTKL